MEGKTVSVFVYIKDGAVEKIEGTVESWEEDGVLISAHAITVSPWHPDKPERLLHIP